MVLNAIYEWMTYIFIFPSSPELCPNDPYEASAQMSNKLHGTYLFLPVSFPRCSVATAISQMLHPQTQA